MKQTYMIVVLLSITPLYSFFPILIQETPEDKLVAFIEEKKPKLEGAMCRMVKLYKANKIQYGELWEMLFITKLRYPESSFDDMTEQANKAVEKFKLRSQLKTNLLSIIAAHKNSDARLNYG